MGDIDDTLLRHADAWRNAQPAPPGLPGDLPGRPRVPRAWSAVAVAAMLCAVLGGVALARRDERPVQLSTGATTAPKVADTPAPQPVAPPASKEPPPVTAATTVRAAPTPPPCVAAQLQVSLAWQGATSTLAISTGVLNKAASICSLPGVPAISILDGGQPLPIEQAPAPVGAPVLSIRPGQSALILSSWSNWCGGSTMKLGVQLRWSDGLTVKQDPATGDGSLPVLGPPQCLDSSAPSRIAAQISLN